LVGRTVNATWHISDRVHSTTNH